MQVYEDVKHSRKALQTILNSLKLKNVLTRNVLGRLVIEK